MSVLPDAELLTEFGNLYEKLHTTVRFPPPRSASRLLPLLPASTVFYVATSNYGDAAQEALNTFHRELQQNDVLKKWWTSGDMVVNGPKIEEAIAKFHDIAGFLGDEMVIAGSMEKSNAKIALIAQIAKPGLKPVLQKVLNDATANAKTTERIRTVDTQDLAGLSDTTRGGDLVVLVRADYLVAASDVGTLKSFNARLDGPGGEFNATPFGQRILRAYQDGVTVVGGADLHTILTQGLGDKKEEIATAKRSGFSDMEYLVWEHTNSSGREISQSELSFLGPRRGMAAWIGAPTQLGGLDFASPNAIMAMSLKLASPAQMYENLRELGPGSPNPLSGLTDMERTLHVSVKDDLLQLLTGEITVAIDSVMPPAWKLVLGVKDPVRMQQTLRTMLAAQHVTAEQSQQAGITFHTVRSGTGPAASAITYAFVDGYLVIAADAPTAKEAVRMHRSGESLAKAQKFLMALPPGHENGMSAVVYQDPTAMAALQMQRISPGTAATRLAPTSSPLATVMTVYASDTTIRGESTSQTMDAGMIGIVAAIALPNLLRSSTAANETSALASLRTVNIAEITYRSTYSDRGFAPDLATLGPGAGATADADHAGLLDAALGCEAGPWCEKSGYKFRVTAVCIQGQCAQYVAIATPVNNSTGQRNFCSTADGIIRWRIGPPLTTAIRAAECKTWAPLQ